MEGSSDLWSPLASCIPPLCFKNNLKAFVVVKGAQKLPGFVTVILVCAARDSWEKHYVSAAPDGTGDVVSIPLESTLRTPS